MGYTNGDVALALSALAVTSGEANLVDAAVAVTRTLCSDTGGISPDPVCIRSMFSTA